MHDDGHHHSHHLFSSQPITKVFNQTSLYHSQPVDRHSHSPACFTPNKVILSPFTSLLLSLSPSLSLPCTMSQLLQSISEVTAHSVSLSSVDVENNKNKHNHAKSKVPSISYSKDFLLGLQFAPSSLVKPELPNLHFLSDRVSCF